MAATLWAKCKGSSHIAPLHATSWRLVEAQDITSTRKLVDTLEEQQILEELLDSTKPRITSKLAQIHPLLYTPFRYPPLKYGSRFGSRSEHSLWYGSLMLETAMAEKAFYQFNFLRASKAVFGMVETSLTAFSTQVKTTRGINLTQAPFSKHTNTISSPISYETSQTLGRAMREAGVEIFCYQSARDPKQRTNLALFTPNAFLHKNPNTKSFQSWQSIAHNQTIEFIRSNAMTNESKSFSIDSFLVNNKLPFPAN